MSDSPLQAASEVLHFRACSEGPSVFTSRPSRKPRAQLGPRPGSALRCQVWTLARFPWVALWVASTGVAQAPSTDAAQSEVAADPGPSVGEARVESSSVVAARRAVRRAEALFSAHNFGGALTEFERAYELLDGDPRQAAVLNNIAVCHERMFRYELALAFYRRYLAEAAPTAADRTEVQAIVAALDNLLGTLEIRVDTAAEIWVDHHYVGEAPGRVRIPAGTHLVELRAPVAEAARRELRIAAGQTTLAEFELRRLSQFRGLDPAFFWFGSALTLAAVTTGTVLGLNALAQSDREQSRVEMAEDPDLGAVRRRAMAADLAFGTAAVFGVSSAVLFFLTDWEGEQPEHPLQPTRLGLAPRAGGAAASLEWVWP